MSKATLLCPISECDMVVLVAGASYAAWQVAVIGDTPVIVDRAVTSGQTFGAITAATRIQLDASTNSSAGTANFSAGNGVFLDPTDFGALAGTGGNSAGVLVGTCLVGAAKTDGSVICSFSAETFMAAADVKRA